MNDKNSQIYTKTNTFSHATPKRLPRQSEPSYAIEGILTSVAKIKEQHQSRRTKRKKQARLSEIQPLHTNTTMLSPSKFEDLKSHGHHGFLSPNSGLEERFLKKCSSSSAIANEILSPRNLRKREIPTTQLKAKRQVGKDKKDSLNIIEQMLSNHINVNHMNNMNTLNSPSSRKRNVKSPRFSEPLVQQNQYQFMQHKKKENQSLGNSKKEGKQSKLQEIAEYSCMIDLKDKQKQLKETVSTLSSFNSQSKFNNSGLKITDFQFIKELGKGKFGCVKLALHKKTKMLFSIKMIKKSVIRQENIVQQIIKQIKIQSFINHSHIVKLYTVFHDRVYVYLVLEACNEGNLYSHMQSKVKVSEQEGGSIMKAICQAVAQLHQYQIIHRDLKPQNIVLCYNMPKICDFGWSTCLKDSMRETFCGTPLYVSPQLLSGQLYDQKVDLWALGIMGYQMMVGNIPFNIKSERDLRKIIDSQIKYPKELSNDAVDFLRSLLQKRPQQRKSLQILLDHPFLNKKKKQLM